MRKPLACLVVLFLTARLGIAAPSGGRSSYSSKPSSSPRSSSPRSNYSSKPSSSPKPSSPKSTYSPKPPSVSRPAPHLDSKPSYSSKPKHEANPESGRVFQNPNSHSTPAAPTWDHQGNRAAEKQESKSKWQADQAKRVARDNASQDAVRAREAQSRSFQSSWSPEKKQTRATRESDFYRGTQPITVEHHYRDGYSNLFWSWMLLQSLDNRAEWAYHHRDSMDPERYRELVASNSELKAKIDRLEQENKTRDPNYKPPEMKDSDLMYETQHIEKQVSPKKSESMSVLSRVVLATIVLGLMAVLVWGIFCYRF